MKHDYIDNWVPNISFPSCSFDIYDFSFTGKEFFAYYAEGYEILAIVIIKLVHFVYIHVCYNKSLPYWGMYMSVNLYSLAVIPVLLESKYSPKVSDFSSCSTVSCFNLCTGIPVGKCHNGRRKIIPNHKFLIFCRVRRTDLKEYDGLARYNHIDITCNM